MNNTENNKRIAKNAMFLYFRLLITLGISLYTVRLVLEILGVVDFGIYNVAGGIVFMMEFLKSSMSASVQRFLSYELGNKNYTQLNKVFSMSINIHILIIIFVLIIAETIGLWFVNTQLIIPIDRINAANWVYQFSVFTFIVGLFTTSYNAVIVSEERMEIYSYVSIFETIAKLAIVLFLYQIEFDKLITYSILISTLSLLILIFYIFYCNKNFPSTRYIFISEKKLFYKLLNFGQWNLFGGIAGVAMGQGTNILLNIFFGPAINAARGVAYQVGGAINLFVVNLQVAINPQIVKSYAVDDTKYMHELIFQGSKFSFYLVYLLCLPILFETEYIFNLWLTNVPEYTIIFTKLIFISILIDSLSGSLMTAAQASGIIKKYQMIIGGLLLINLPVSYIFLKLGYPPQVTLFVSIFISIIALFCRLFIVSKLVNISVILFFKKVLKPVLLIAVLSPIMPLILKLAIQPSFMSFFLTILLTVLSVTTSIYWFGLATKEKKYLEQKMKHILTTLKLLKSV
jgi:O-antigen/teichoic acid export membrane protein